VPPDAVSSSARRDSRRRTTTLGRAVGFSPSRNDSRVTIGARATRIVPSAIGVSRLGATVWAMSKRRREAGPALSSRLIS
jgi:hypothetical protein